MIHTPRATHYHKIFFYIYSNKEELNSLSDILNDHFIQNQWFFTISAEDFNEEQVYKLLTERFFLET